MSTGEEWENGPPPGLFDDGHADDHSAPRDRSVVRRLPVRLGNDLHRVVDQAVARLANAENLYSRAGRLVSVIRDPAPPEGATRERPSAFIRDMHAATILEVLTRVAEFQRWDSRADDWVETTPPDRVVRAIEHRGTWAGIRPIVGVVEAPVLRSNGTVVQDPGYDAATGLLYLPSSEFERIPDEPTRADAERAARDILDAVVDFPFASDAHRAAWLAFVLTPFARPAINGCCPLMAVDATTRGSGKTRLVDVVALLATGRIATKMTMPEEDDEFRKRITALVMEGEVLACIDNVSGHLKFPTLDAALTATTWKDRRLGGNEMVSAPNLIVYSVTGNNLVFGADTARRTLHIRLESPLENPEDRETFTHGDIIEWTREERPRLVVAALTLLRAYASARFPSRVKPWGSFEAWSRVVAGAVVWAGLPDPQSTRGALESTSDEVKLALAGLIEGWDRLSEGKPLAVREALAVLYPLRTGGTPAPPDGFDGLREAVETLAPPAPGKAPTAKTLGNALKAFRRRVVGGRMLEGSTDRTKVMRWTVVDAPKAPEVA